MINTIDWWTFCIIFADNQAKVFYFKKVVESKEAALKLISHSLKKPSTSSKRYSFLLSSTAYIS